MKNLILHRESLWSKSIRIVFLSVLFTSLALSCSDEDERDNGDDEDQFKQRMRDLVMGISQNAKTARANFNVIPQNGIELVTRNGDSSGEPHIEYLNAIDANGQEDLFYGYNNDNEETPSDQTTYLKELLDISKNALNTILVTDYCSTPAKVDNSYLQNSNSGYISFAATARELNVIPAIPVPIHNENNTVITSLSQAKNFLYLINPDGFATKIDFINAVKSTNYDVLIMDLFFTDGSEFTLSEINDLKNKSNGGKRLVISYMSIGEVEDYRYYWKSAWNTTKPSWIKEENPDWPGNYKVEYWNTEWQSIIYGNDDSYLKKILDAGFDGVYLDIIDAFEYFE